MCESRLPVGSSAKSSVGWLISERAMATRCCSPPESLAGEWSKRDSRPTIVNSSRLCSQHAAPRASVGRVARGHPHVFQRRRPRQQVEALKDKANAAAAELRQLRRR